MWQIYRRQHYSNNHRPPSSMTAYIWQPLNTTSTTIFDQIDHPPLINIINQLLLTTTDHHVRQPSPSTYLTINDCTVHRFDHYWSYFNHHLRLPTNSFGRLQLLSTINHYYHSHIWKLPLSTIIIKIIINKL